MTDRARDIVRTMPYSISPSSRVTAGYVTFASLWIFFSDTALSRFVSSERFAYWSMIKGWVFVAITAGLLDLLIRTANRQRKELARESACRQELLERQLCRLQRVDAVGGLAIGVCHDLSNLLTPILLAAGALQQTPRGRDLDKDLVQTIEECALGSSKLLQQLLSLGREGVASRQPLDLNSVVGDLARLARLTLPSSIEVRPDLTEPAVQVSADPVQVRQILANLTSNARDAMPEGGVLTLSVRELEVRQGGWGLAAGQYARIDVSDTGRGIPPALQSKVFEPFFTTRLQQGGTGLGLTTSARLAVGMGGALVLSRSSKDGTCLSLFLPVLRAG